MEMAKTGSKIVEKIVKKYASFSELQKGMLRGDDMI
jgi:hypothetical protein